MGKKLFDSIRKERYFRIKEITKIAYDKHLQFCLGYNMPPIEGKTLSKKEVIFFLSKSIKTLAENNGLKFVVQKKKNEYFDELLIIDREIEYLSSKTLSVFITDSDIRISRLQDRIFSFYEWKLVVKWIENFITLPLTLPEKQTRRYIFSNQREIDIANSTIDGLVLIAQQKYGISCSIDKDESYFYAVITFFKAIEEYKIKVFYRDVYENPGEVLKNIISQNLRN